MDTWEIAKKRSLPIMVFVLFVAGVTYVSTYYILVDKTLPTSMILPAYDLPLKARYSSDAQINSNLATFFGPIHYIDREFRSDFWTIEYLPAPRF